MEKLGFNDLVALAKLICLDYDKLLCQSSDGNLTSLSGIIYHRDSDGATTIDCISAERASDDAYDKLSVLIKVLKGIQEYRPLPF